MAYCTVDDLNDYAAHLDIDDYTDPTSTEVTAMIATVDTIMDQKFKSVGVTVPVTDSDLLQVVKDISINGSLARLYRSMSAEPETAAIFQGLFDDAIKEILKRPSILSSGDNEAATPEGSTRRDGADAPFERGVTQW